MMGLFSGSRRKKSVLEKSLDMYLKKKANELARESRKRELGPSRRLGAIQDQGDEFPLGVLGLQEVVTSYPNKSLTCYWFSTEESRNVLIGHVEKANDIIEEARRLSGIDIDFIRQVQFDVKPFLSDGSSAWGFTRADWSPVTSSGNPSATPVKAYIETHTSISNGSHSVVIHYGKKGEIKKLVIKYYATPQQLTQINVSAKKGELLIKSITQQDGAASYVIYEA